MTGSECSKPTNECGIIPIYVTGGPCVLPRGDHGADHQTANGTHFTRGNWPDYRRDGTVSPDESPCDHMNHVIYSGKCSGCKQFVPPATVPGSPRSNDWNTYATADENGRTHDMPRCTYCYDGVRSPNGDGGCPACGGVGHAY